MLFRSDTDEKLLFTVELDGQNKRMIASDDAGRGTYQGFSGSGFLTGILIGSMLGRQRAAGIQPGSFSNRRLASPASYTQGRRTRARSRARSGGLRFGK